MKNVLLVGSYPPPYGGISSQVENSAADLVRNGYRVFVIALGPEAVSENGCLTIYRVDLRKNFRKLVFKLSSLTFVARSFRKLRARNLAFREALRVISLSFYLKAFIGENKVMLVHFYDMSSGFVIPMLREEWKISVPFVLTMYADIYQFPEFYKRRRELIREMLHGTQKVLSSSRYAAQSVEKLGLDASLIEPLYYGIDINMFSPKTEKNRVRKEFDIGADEKIALFVGRLKKEMGLDAVLEIMPKLFQDRHDLKLIIIGAKGELERESESFCQEYPRRAFLRSNLASSELPFYYADCDFLIAPTNAHHASMGMSIKEAMASGKVVIATDAPGIREAVINEETGFLVPAGDNGKINSKDLYELILEVLGNENSLRAMEINARKRAEELFDRTSTSNRVIGIFESLLEGHRD